MLALSTLYVQPDHRLTLRAAGAASIFEFVVLIAFADLKTCFPSINP